MQSKSRVPAGEGRASHLNDEGFCGGAPGVEELWGQVPLGGTVVVQHRAGHPQCPAEVNRPVPIQVILPSHVLDSWTNTRARERIIRTPQGCSCFHSILCHEEIGVTIIPHQCCPSRVAFLAEAALHSNSGSCLLCCCRSSTFLLHSQMPPTYSCPASAFPTVSCWSTADVSLCPVCH